MSYVYQGYKVLVLYGCFDLSDLLTQYGIMFHHIADEGNGMEHGSMCTASHAVAYFGKRTVCHLLAEIDGNVSRHRDVPGAVLRHNCLLRDVVMLGNGIHHILDGDCLRLEGHDMTYHFLSQREIDLLVGKGGMRQKRSENTFQITHGVAYVSSNEIHDLIREDDTVPTHLGEQDILTQGIVRRRDFRRQAPFETREQTILDIFELYRRLIAGQDELFATLLQVIEDMEEGILCSFESREILDIIDDKYIDRLVEIEEIRYSVFLACVLELQFERIRANIKYTCVRVERLRLMPDRAGKMGRVSGCWLFASFLFRVRP